MEELSDKIKAILKDEIDEDWISLWDIISVTNKVFQNQPMTELDKKVDYLKPIVIDIIKDGRIKVYECTTEEMKMVNGPKEIELILNNWIIGLGMRIKKSCIELDKIISTFRRKTICVQVKVN